MAPIGEDDLQSPSAALDALAQEALKVVKKARRHQKSLAGDNFYGNKLGCILIKDSVL